MNKNTTLITAITALFVAFLVLTTACLPAGNTDLSNLTEAKATYKSLLLDDAETHKHNEEQEIDTYVSKDETHQEASDHGHSHNEVAVVPEMGQTQLVVEVASPNEDASSNEVETTETQNSEAADAEIKRLQHNLKLFSPILPLNTPGELMTQTPLSFKNFSVQQLTACTEI